MVRVFGRVQLSWHDKTGKLRKQRAEELGAMFAATILAEPSRARLLARAQKRSFFGWCR